jgi:PadR family transcriptional regulator AphA
VREKSRLSPDYIVLGFLREKPMHGYELHQRFQAALGRVWNVGLSHIYALLKTLEEDGFVQATRELQDNRPSRLVYHITEAGQEAFLRWLREPVESIRQVRLEFLGKLYFCQQMGPPAVEQLVARQTERCRQLAESLRQAEADSPAEAVFDHLVLRFRLGQVQAVLNWLHDCQQELLTPSPDPSSSQSLP